MKRFVTIIEGLELGNKPFHLATNGFTQKIQKISSMKKFEFTFYAKKYKKNRKSRERENI